MKEHSRELVIGQVVGQVSLLLAIPALTRLLPVPEMGIYQTGFSIALILQPLATLRSELLIPVSSALDARRHRVVGLGFAVVCSAIIALAALPIWMAANQTLAETLLTTAVILLSFALIYVENAYLIRCGHFRRLAIRNLVAGVASAALQIAAALMAPTALAIAIALLLGRAIATATTIVRTATADELPGGGERKSQRSISAILSAMVAAASSQAVVIGTFGTLGSSAAAQVAIGQRIGGAPTTLIGQALSQISLGAAAPLIRGLRPGLTTQLRAQTIRTGGAATLTATALMVLGPLLAVPVLGQGWELAGVLTAVFAIPLSLQLVALPATTLLIPLGRERLLLVLQASRLTTILVALVVTSTLTGDVIATCVVASVVWTAAYIPIMIASFLATSAHDRAAPQEDIDE